MPVVVGVSFRRGGRVRFYDADRLVLKVGDEVIVPTEKGTAYGRVVTSPRHLPDSPDAPQLEKVIRRATDEDRRQMEKNEVRRERALRKGLELIAKHGLPMKLVDVDFPFEGGTITFYFTADGRVDFRALVRDLASALKSRIELRQIGVRDEAKMVGGLGPCGQPLCCAQFLNQFHPISIRMAKEQNLPLNPAKISGLCGRLMCCLRFEYDQYRRFLLRVPAVGEEVEVEGSPARVVAHDYLHERVILEREDGERLVLPADHFGPEPELEEEMPEPVEDEIVGDEEDYGSG
ncbi:MAG: stage 0 sporulation family protein [Candidatus Geothermincolales bacterium]